MRVAHHLWFRTRAGSREHARECLVLPLGHGHFPDDCLVIAVPSPTDFDMLQRLNFILNRNLAVVEAARERLEEAINRHYRKH
jgi:type IV pilus assembly protein PilB